MCVFALMHTSDLEARLGGHPRPCVSLFLGTAKHLGYLLGKICQVLDDLGHQDEGARSGITWVLLREAKQAGRHDGRAQEAQEEGC